MDTLEQDVTHIQWKTHYTVEPAPVDLNQGDKIVLPASALEQLLQQAGSGNLPSPLTFELRHPHSSTTLHCGVKEFSSSSNTAQLPSWIMSTLNVKQGDHILIKLVTLPKGTWAKLQPISAGYREITDYRAALEAHLRGHYNTLTQGQNISCRFGGHLYQFKVLELKPQEAVSITDTDLEVDIQHEAPFEQVKMAQVKLNETVSHVTIDKNDYKYWKLILFDKQNISVKLTVETGDADIVCSTEQSPTLDHHQWSDLSSDNERSITLSPITSSTDHIYIGIHSFTENTTISWIATTTIATDTDTEMEDIDDHHTGKEQCRNCHAWVLQRTLVLHEGFCLRNNIVCPWGCGKVFKKDSQELQNHWHCDQCDHRGENGRDKHIDYYHTPKACTCTHFSTHSYEALAEHKRTICPEKLITCRFCHVSLIQYHSTKKKGVLIQKKKDFVCARSRFVGLER
ncbi:ubiquitin fusion degradation protein UFD1-domain-containing protein [Helicostylum pulchrum]|nr:ubiquitin fusion degradation protein UFD1-domain-containing protein [Helicostylum pulchrum]